MFLNLIVDILFIGYFLVNKQLFKQNIKVLIFGVLTVQFISLGVLYERSEFEMSYLLSIFMTLFCVISLTHFETKKQHKKIYI